MVATTALDSAKLSANRVELVHLSELAELAGFEATDPDAQIEQSSCNKFNAHRSSGTSHPPLPVCKRQKMQFRTSTKGCPF
jgi:hypothetical protein